MKLYGSLQNRLEENRQYCPDIVVGTGVTEYLWSDRHPYEVVEVVDQKHVVVRALDHVHTGSGSMDNSWKLVSNPDNVLRRLEKRGAYWYWTSTVTREQFLAADVDVRLRMILAGIQEDVVLEKGKQTCRTRANVSFGVADYYYDYEF